MFAEAFSEILSETQFRATVNETKNILVFKHFQYLANRSSQLLPNSLTFMSKFDPLVFPKYFSLKYRETHLK